MTWVACKALLQGCTAASYPVLTWGACKALLQGCTAASYGVLTWGASKALLQGCTAASYGVLTWGACKALLQGCTAASYGVLTWGTCKALLQGCTAASYGVLTWGASKALLQGCTAASYGQRQLSGTKLAGMPYTEHDEAGAKQDLDCSWPGCACVSRRDSFSPDISCAAPKRFCVCPCPHHTIALAGRLRLLHARTPTHAHACNTY